MEEKKTAGRINRNILECKDEIQKQRSSGFPVLIETYWNVKSVALISIAGCLPGINRNILECKGCIHFPERCRVLVLIETYWNVKSSAPALYASFRTVLIETYWNVKLLKERRWRKLRSY